MSEPPTTLKATLYTAIVTPFTPSGELDLPAMEKLVHHIVEQGSQGIVVNGSTGENPTLSWQEKLTAVKTVQRVLEGTPVEVVVGCTTNSTKDSIEYAKETAALGVNGLLVVVPFYNKPSQRGMVAHFSAIAQAVPATPILMYNVPSRTGATMAPSTAAELAGMHANIVGIKQSVPDMDAMSALRKLTPDNFTIWSGDDSLTLPMMALGAYGCVSVAGHVLGRPIRELIDAVHQGNMPLARQRHLQCFECFGELFFLPNPTVVKAVLARQGLIGPTLREPLVEATPEEALRIDRLVEKIAACQLLPA